ELVFRRQFADAVRPLRKALQLDSDQTGANLLLAVCDINMEPRRLSEAASSLTACIKTNPNLVGFYLMRAYVFGEEGNEAQRRVGAERAGDRSAARFKQDAADAFAAAESDYDRALGLKHDDELHYVLLANRGLMRLQSGRLDKAVEDLES